MNCIRTIALVLPLATMLVPARADAQWRPIYPGYPSYRYAMPESDLRFDIRPKEASVYIDGYFAGLVDDFNGAFERLHVTPGEHEIVVYLQGHHSLHQRLYLSVNRTRKIEGRLEPLGPGEAAEPVPTPAEPRDAYDEGPVRGRPMPPRYPPGPRTEDPRDRDRRDPDPRDREPQTRRVEPSNTAGATLAIRVQPGGATVLIDGERWQGPSDNSERLIVQVAEGHHTVEVQRDGYERFTTEIDARRGETVPVNVSLRKD